MPWLFKSCRCGARVPIGQRCRECERKRKKESDARRGNFRQRGSTRAWDKLSRLVAAEEPLCRMCLAEGLAVVGTQRDHIIPVRERPDLMYERSNIQNLCARHHSEKTAREDGGFGN